MHVMEGARSNFLSKIDVELMTIGDLETDQEYSKNFHLLTKNLLSEVFSLLFNYQLMAFQKLVHAFKSEGEPRSKEPISIERLFDLDKVVKFQGIENALEIHDLHAIYKKYDCNLHKGTYKHFGMKKLG